MQSQRDKKHIAANIVIWALTALWLIVIFLFSSYPDYESDEQTLFVIDVLNTIFGLDLSSGDLFSSFGFLQSIDFIIRKSAHFIEYFILGVLSFISLRDLRYLFKKQRMAQSVIAVSFCALYAVSDEIHQLFVEGRYGCLRDVLIDTSGSVLAVMICLFTIWTAKKCRRKTH